MSIQNPFTSQVVHHQTRQVIPESVVLDLKVGSTQVRPLILQELRALVSATEEWPAALTVDVTTVAGRLAALRVVHQPPAPAAPATPQRVNTVQEIRELPPGTLLEYIPNDGQYARLFFTQLAATKVISLRDTTGNRAAAGPIEVRQLLDQCAPHGMRVVWDPASAQAESASR